MMMDANTCPNCQTQFICDANSGDCWCCSLPKVMPMEEVEKGCYCPKCLEEMIRERLEEEKKT